MLHAYTEHIQNRIHFNHVKAVRRYVNKSAKRHNDLFMNYVVNVDSFSFI